ncbi:hypothetical protein [Desulfobacter curvatus]|uniref:hypothetical protein n=1 Tax=Desulfobacter curvatus TaxID=2290 RepID=UPI00036E4641|nr:hypothetical protein [Desulfobacter curvatus]
MGHSYIEIGERSHLMHDGIIIAVCYIMVDTAHREASKIDLTLNVRSLLKAWQSLVEDSAPGCIDLDLDRFLLTPADRNSLYELAHKARNYVRRFGPKVPGPYLNNLIKAPYLMEFDDQPTDKILAAYDVFMALLL